MTNRRKSTTKSSMFKLQSAKKVYEEYVKNILQCEVLKVFPMLDQKSLIESSQTVLNYCFQFTEETPFTRGLNYGCKELGFSNHQGKIQYRQYLPEVFKVYLMGDFNDFNQKSHQMTPVEDSDNFFEIDLNVYDIDEGTRLLLKVTDFKGQTYNMIPPSCMLVSQDHGIFIRYRKSPFCSNQTLLTDVLSYSLDMDVIQGQNALNFLKKYKNTLEQFNVIIIKNWWIKGNKLTDRFKLKHSNLDTFVEIIEFIHREIGIKTVLEINSENSTHSIQRNSVEQKFQTIQENGTKNWNLQNPQTFQYYLSALAYYITYFNTDGFYFSHIDHLLQQSEAITLLKCISIMKNRMFDHGILFSQSTQNIPALCYPILEGGMGVDFAIEALDIKLTNSHRNLVQDIQKCSPFSNCLKIKGTEEDMYLKLLLVYISSPKGVSYEGNLQNNVQNLTKVLHLRRQQQLFQHHFQLTEIGSEMMTAKRGNIYFCFNFSENQINLKISDFLNLQLIFNSSNEQPLLTKEYLNIKSNCCHLYEIKPDE